MASNHRFFIMQNLLTLLIACSSAAHVCSWEIVMKLPPSYGPDNRVDDEIFYNSTATEGLYFGFPAASTSPTPPLVYLSTRRMDLPFSGHGNSALCMASNHRFFIMQFAHHQCSNRRFVASTTSHYGCFCDSRKPSAIASNFFRCSGGIVAADEVAETCPFNAGQRSMVCWMLFSSMVKRGHVVSRLAVYVTRSSQKLKAGFSAASTFGLLDGFPYLGLPVPLRFLRKSAWCDLVPLRQAFCAQHPCCVDALYVDVLMHLTRPTSVW
ncbi:hypothetical protein HPB51_014501 [Rhipicephalus microplus]|uniref:Secreted protein n=1 Tax=Rhipicephalus microplus TaxID=6941 RepID=A0A9J6EGI5_RHIMP|nr:hypothetical protein HPB51_014501 [Rhipicephalus microplus]